MTGAPASVHGPLHGLRVLEFGQIAAGPFAGSLLADLGADVVKVERPDGGDGMRDWPPLVPGEGQMAGSTFSGNFASVNRNKRSVAIDLKAPEDIATVIELAAAADIVLENFRPGVLARFGLDYASLEARNPRLVYCSISGYGQSGPYAQRGAFDVTVQAMSGLMSVTGYPGGDAAKCGVPVGDFVAGLYGAYSCVSAVLECQRTGKGSFIDCSMLGGLLGVSALQTSEYFGTGRDPVPLGTAHPRNAPYQAFKARDKEVVVAAGNNELWRRLCVLMGVQSLLEDERFLTQRGRAEHQAALAAALQPVFALRDADDWLDELDRHGIPCSPILRYSETLSSEHVQSMGVVHDLELPNGAIMKTVVFPVQIGGHRSMIYRPPPQLGEHTQEVSDEWLPR